MTTTTAVKDLVCGMDLDPATTDRRAEHEGQTYYFCSATCKQKFDSNPEQYVNQPAAVPQSDGCCS